MKITRAELKIVQLVAVACAVVLLASLAESWNEPADFRGIPWGASQKEGMRILKERDKCKQDIYGSCPTMVGRFGIQYNGAWIGDTRANIWFEFLDGGFAGADFFFPVEKFESIKTAFLDKYGMPTSESSSVLVWSGNRVIITLRRYTSVVTRSWASVATKALIERDAARQENQRKRAAGDL